MKWFFAVLLLAAQAVAAPLSAPQYISGATTMTGPEIVSLRSNTPQTVVIDTRRPTDFSRGHLPGAVNLPAHAVNTQLAELVPNHTTPLLFYCGGPDCIRASIGVKEAVEQGYTRIYYYYGGLADWQNHNYPVE